MPENNRNRRAPRQTLGARFSKRTLAVLFLILAGALAVRVWRLGDRSFWYDEAWGAALVIRGLGEGLSAALNGRFYPPLHQVLLTLWMVLLGYSETSARLLSVVPGLLSIPLIFLLGREIHSQRAGLVAAMLLAFSAFNIEFSREARGYSLFAFLTLGSFLFFLRLLRSRPDGSGQATKGDLIPYLAFSVLLPYSHLYGFFVVATQNVAFLLLRKRDFPLKSWLFCQLGLILAWSPLALPLAQQARVVTGGFWIEKRNLLSAVSSTLYLFGNNSALLTVILVTFAALGLLGLRSATTLTLFLWFAFLTVVPAGISLFATPIYLEKYALPASSAFYLLAALGLTSLPYRRIRVVLAGVLLVLTVSSLKAYQGFSPHEDWRGVATALTREATARDVILAYEAYPFDDLSRPFQYYLRGSPLLRQIHRVRESTSGRIYRPPDNISPVPETFSQALRSLPTGATVWLVLTHLPTSGTPAALTPALPPAHTLLSSREFPGIELLHFAMGKD